MYRAVALLARRRGISWDDPEGLGRLTAGLNLECIPDGEQSRLVADGEDLSGQIRTPEISAGASAVARWPAVRAALVAQQQRMGEGGGVVMEGRDIGTVVFPEAGAKIFLTASPEERARRRTEELAGRGETADPDTVLREVIERDEQDSTREHSPLRKAEDAVEVITDGLTLEQVVDRLEALVRRRERG
jgi:CMP/dCMP kinase